MLIALRRVSEDRLSSFPSMAGMAIVVEGVEEYLDGSLHQFVAGWSDSTGQWVESEERKLPPMYWNNFSKFHEQARRSWWVMEWFAATSNGQWTFKGAEKPEVPETHHLWE